MQGWKTLRFNRADYCAAGGGVMDPRVADFKKSMNPVTTKSYFHIQIE